MPVCLKCGYELVYGPAGCACTQAARHKRQLEEAGRIGEELVKKLKMVTTKKGKNLIQALIRDEKKALEARQSEIKRQQDLLAADVAALQKKCKHPKIVKSITMVETNEHCPDCGYQT